MAAQVVSLFQRFQRSSDWTQKELAEFYRVESALIQAGLQLETDQGVSDEGDPWFVFCRADNGEVFIHFARIDGQYIAIGAALDQVVRGRDFASLVQEMLATQAWVMAKARNQSNVFLHPAALLIALVGASFFHSSEAKAAEHTSPELSTLRRHTLPILIQGDGPQAPALDTATTAAIITSVLIGLNELAPANTALADWSSNAGDLSAAAGHLAAPATLDAALPALANLITTQTGLVISGESQPPASAIIPAHAAANLELLDATASSSVSLIPIDHSIADPSTPSTHTSIVAHLDFIAPVAAATVALIQSSTSDAAEAFQASNILGYLSGQSNFAPQQSLLGAEGSLHQNISSDPGGASQLGGSSDTGSSGVTVSQPASSSSQGAAHPIVMTGLLATSSIVATAIAHFAGEVSNLDVASTGHDIVLYDGAIFNGHAASGQTDVVTFDFIDGSSITLVGTASEVQNLHLSLS